MKKSLQSAITTWVTAAIVLTVGILCIVAQNADTNGSQRDNTMTLGEIRGSFLVTMKCITWGHIRQSRHTELCKGIPTRATEREGNPSQFHLFLSQMLGNQFIKCRSADS